MPLYGIMEVLVFHKICKELNSYFDEIFFKMGKYKSVVSHLRSRSLGWLDKCKYIFLLRSIYFINPSF